ncbi:MAG: SDR family NAD(P)-dependent oxidoreductase [Myxococcota bacterium]
MSGEFSERYGPWAIVTGASSGIGAEFARQLAARKLNVVLVARSKDKLETLADELVKAHGIEARVAPADLMRADFLDALAPALEDLDVGLLLNNAGYTLTGHVLDLPADKQLGMVDLNCRAPLALTQHVGPKLKQRGRGGIIFTASVVGFGGAAYWATYNATKGFAMLLAEGIGAELGPAGIDVQALCPGGTLTGFQAAGGVDAKKFGALASLFFMKPEAVVSTSLRRLGGARVVVPGFVNKMTVLSGRFIPRRLNTWILGRFVQLMAH